MNERSALPILAALYDVASPLLKKIRRPSRSANLIKTTKNDLFRVFSERRQIYGTCTDGR